MYNTSCQNSRSDLKHQLLDKADEYLRMQVCLLSEQHVVDERIVRKKSRTIAELIPPVKKDILQKEISGLPPDQCLVCQKQFRVYYGYYEQIPSVVREISRLREKTFRDVEEGTGLSCDTDKYDHTYTHLFTWDFDSKKIIGAYRMGQTDRLLADGDVRQLYLSNLFQYNTDFLKKVSPGLEMGRSFVISEYQRSYYGLLLLFKGIFRFVAKFPHYHTFFGTVSISMTYSPVSIALMKETLLGCNMAVKPIHDFHCRLGPEVKSYIEQYGLSLDELSRLVQCMEPDHKKLPVLIRQYIKLGACFQSIALDTGFNNTPGALITVNIPAMHPKLLKFYFGEAYPSYLKKHKPEPDIASFVHNAM